MVRASTSLPVDLVQFTCKIVPTTSKCCSQTSYLVVGAKENLEKELKCFLFMLLAKASNGISMTLRKSAVPSCLLVMVAMQ